VLRAALPDEEMYREDRNSLYMEFREDLEEAYFQFKFEPGKEVRRATGVNPEIFFLLAYVLVEKENLDEALEVLDRGLRFNPLHTKLLFERAEIFKLRKDWKRFKETADLCWEYAYNADDVARVYRDYGYMLIELQKFDAAVCCYLISLNFAETDTAQEQVLYISSVTGKAINLQKTIERMEELLVPQDIPIYPNPDMVGIARVLAQWYEKEKKYERALACHQVVFDLTAEAETKRKITSLRKKTRTQQPGRGRRNKGSAS